MAYLLQYFYEVEKDVHTSKVWYKAQREGLELEFSSSIEKAINHILENPLAYAVCYKKIRIAHPKIFPYNIHFYFESSKKTVVITAIVHNKRHPKAANKRI